MTDTDPQAPSALSGEVEPCRECGVPMAPDQRYCLNCGRRRGEPRVDFQQHLSTNGTSSPAEPAGVAPVVPAPVEQKPQRDYTPVAAAGGIAVLGLMLLIGVLIGRGDGTASAPTAAPVVRLPAGVEGEGSEAKESAGGAGEKGGGLNLGGKGESKGGGKAAKAPPPEAVVSDDELKSLEEQSPQEYSENSAKLPDEIATPGTAPPTDNKTPGGGSSGTTIE